MLNALRLLRSGFTRELSKVSIEDLSMDSLVEITSYLTICDVMSLRLVSRAFYKLTYTSVIWKRLLRKARLPIALTPPTVTNSFGNLPEIECERALRNAYLLDQNWKKLHLEPTHNWFDTHSQVHNMSLLPGGRYIIIASTEPRTGKYLMTLWDLEFPSISPINPHKRRAALARTVIPGRVIEIKTNYMPIFGFQGIVIALLCSTSASDKPLVFTIFYISLENLEEYSKALNGNGFDSAELKEYLGEQPPPFANLTMRTTCSTISSMNLEVMGGTPLIALIRGKSEIVIQNLETLTRTFIFPVAPQEIHKVVIIRKVKVLPNQRHILVIREVKYDDLRRSFLYELYGIPAPRSSVQHAHPIKTLSLEEVDITGVDFFEVSDGRYRDYSIEHEDSSQRLTLQKFQPSDICIWATSSGLVDEKNIPMVLCHRLRAQSTEDSASFWYDPRSSRTQHLNYRPLAISGGAHRAVWILPPQEEGEASLPSSETRSCRVGSIVRYIPPRVCHHPALVESLSAEEPVEIGQILPLQLPSSLTCSLGNGMTTFAFDEGVGRLIITTDSSSVLHVLDFSGYDGFDWKPRCYEQ